MNDFEFCKGQLAAIVDSELPRQDEAVRSFLGKRMPRETKHRDALKAWATVELTKRGGGETAVMGPRGAVETARIMSMCEVVIEEIEKVEPKAAA